MTRIMITGAGSGLNNGATFEPAARGYEVIALENYPQVRLLRYRPSARASALLHRKALDVTIEGDRRRAYDWDVDILVNGAGILEGGAVIDIPGENIRRQLEVNVVGPVRADAGHRPPHGQAETRQDRLRLVGRRHPDRTVLSASIAPRSTPCEAIAQTMAAELQEFGVQVATINPGPFLTGFNDAGS